MPTLDWIGKNAVLAHHLDIPFHLLSAGDSIGDEDSGNLIVQGDNLSVLKALLPYYAQRVKLIYIDPPYNTGQEKWVFSDSVNSSEIRQWLGKVVGDETSDLSRHDKWLCMMYPRLQLLKQFLRTDGVIMVSIDDNENYRLRCIMDEVLGPGNFIAQLVWDKTRKNDAKLFSAGHEYILVYARSLSTLRAAGTVWREPKPGAKEIMVEYRALKERYGDDYEAIEDELQRWYRFLPKGHPSRRLSRYRHVDQHGVWRDRDISWPGGGGPRYDVIHPATGKPCAVPERGWGFATQEVMKEQIRRGLVVFREDHTEPPIRKAHLVPVPDELSTDDGVPLDEEPTEGDEDVGLQVMPSIIYRQAQVAVKLLRKIFDGERTFPNPKDHEVLMRLFRYVIGPDDIVLDSFAGSGSTGHAVLQLNREDGSRRRFILIEIDGDILKDFTIPRIQRVVEGYSYTAGRGQRAFEAGVGGGFRICTLAAPLFDASGHIASEVSLEDLARHVFFTETGSPLPVSMGKVSPPLVGVHEGTAIYLLYNGILGDTRPEGGNILTPSVLDRLPGHEGPKIVYGEGSLLDAETLRERGIIFRQIPYEVRVR